MALLNFSGVTCDKITGLSFTLGSGVIGILRVISKEEKTVVIELAVGEKNPVSGTVAIKGVPLDELPGGSIAWLPEHGGLISNLKVWENVTLPLWYYHRRYTAMAENKVRYWLTALGLAEDDMATLMASTVDKLKIAERRLVGMLRCLLQGPQLLVVDAAVFNGITQDRRKAWVAILEAFVHEEEGRAILVVADADNSLPWEMVKLG